MKHLAMNFVLCFCMLVSPFFALDQSVFMQSTPIFVGQEQFLSRIEKIRATTTQEPLALVLSGGSARAYAHIGVLRQLEKANIIPDFIVANSMGAIIGLFYASGFSPDDIERIITEINLTALFDLVIPTRGGLISTRYFKEALSRLYPDNHFDIADSIIPIIVVAEDLYTKRQIWFAQGNITQIMTAAFAMPVMMEPVNYILNEGQRAFLIDSGTVDLGSISIAAHFSENILVSTALYDPQLNFNSPIVNLNRTFSIGKERALVSDLLKFDPLVIRNDVEHFSFMDFTRIKEIISKGDQATITFLENHKNHPSLAPKENEFLETLHTTRIKTSRATEKFIEDYKKGLKPHSQSLTTGFKLRPNISAIDGPELLLLESISFGLYSFLDYKPIFLRAGVKSNTESYGTDVFINFNPSMDFNLRGFASYMRSYDQNVQNGSFYSGNIVQYTIPLVTNADVQLYARPYLTTEFLSFNNYENFLWITKFGFPLKSPLGKNIAFNIDPYYYFYLKEDILIHQGLGLDSFIDLRPTNLFGFKLAEIFRYTPYDQAAYIFPSDSFRGKVDTRYTGSNPQSYASIQKAELYWYSTQTNYTALEVLKIEKLKLGGYTDFLWHGEKLTELYTFNQNSNLKQRSIITGTFLRTQISLIGIYHVTLDTSLGWNFDRKTVNAQLRFVQYW